MFHPIFSKLSSIEMGSTSFLAAVTAQTPILHAWVRWLVQKAASNGAPALLGSPGRLTVDAPSPTLGKLKENWYLESMQQWFDFRTLSSFWCCEKQCENGENCKLHMIIDSRSAFCLCSTWSFFSFASTVWCRSCGCGGPSCCRFGHRFGCGGNRCSGKRCRCSGRCRSSLIFAGLGRRHAVVLGERPWRSPYRCGRCYIYQD